MLRNQNIHNIKKNDNLDTDNSYNFIKDRKRLKIHCDKHKLHNCIFVVYTQIYIKILFFDQFSLQK